MQDTKTTAVVYAFRPTLPALLVGLVGLIALVLGVVSPAQAGGSSGKGANDDKPWICHPVEGKGELGNGWNLISPDQASRHIDEKTGKGMHTRKDGSTDRYAVKSEGKWVCKDREDDDNGDDGDNGDGRWVCHPLENGEWRLVPPEYAFRHIDEETGKGLHTKAGNTDKFAKKVEGEWVCEESDHETPKPTKTHTPSETSTHTPSETSTHTPSETSTHTPSETPSTGAFTPPATSSPTAPEQAPMAPVVAAAAAPSNVVPAAQTDGADLQGSSQLQPVLIGAGALLLMASGLLSLRRRQVF